MTPPAGPTPELSVVVTSLGSATALCETVAALAHQQGDVQLEVLVPADERVHALLKDCGALSSEVRVVDVGGKATGWELRAAGVRSAGAPIVATLEDLVVPDADWARAVIRAHQAPHAAIGGVIAAREHNTLTSWGLYFIDYARYIPPVAIGATDFLCTCNVSYKREALERVRHAWRGEMHETEVHQELQQAGETLWLDDRIVVRFRRDIPLGAACSELFSHGRKYAEGRISVTPRRWRAARALIAPLVPLRMLAGTAHTAFRSRRTALAWILALPVMVPMVVSWAAGEFRGYGGRVTHRHRLPT